MDQALIDTLPTNFIENISINNPATPAVVQEIGGALSLSESRTVKLINDPFARFHRSALAYGNKTQQIFVRRTRPKPLKADKIKTGDIATLTVDLPVINSRHYVYNVSGKYTTTISEDEIRRSFSPNLGAEDFIANASIRNAVSWETDVYAVCKATLSRINAEEGDSEGNSQGYTAGFSVVPTTVGTTALKEPEILDTMIKQMVDFISGVRRGYSENYNVAGEITSAPGTLIGVIESSMYDRLTAGVSLQSDADKILKDLSARFLGLAVDWIVIDHFDDGVLRSFGWDGVVMRPVATIFDAEMFNRRNVGMYPHVNTAVLPEELAINLYLHIKELHELLQFVPGWAFVLQSGAGTVRVASTQDKRQPAKSGLPTSGGSGIMPSALSDPLATSAMLPAGGKIEGAKLAVTDLPDESPEKAGA